MKLKDFDFRVWDKKEMKYIDINYPIGFNLSENSERVALAFFTKFTYIDILTNKPYERVAPVLNSSDDFEIELFTGFYDIAGKKVYEGDVLGYDVRGEYANCSVFYNKDKAMFVAIVHDEEGSFLYEIQME